MAARFRLDGRTALVTGAAGGIGAALSRALAAEGCALALVDRDADGLAATAASTPGVRVSRHVLDLADADAIARLPDAVAAEHDGLDLLVNNAGVAMGGRFEDVELDDVAWLLDINLNAGLRLTHACLPMLKARVAACGAAQIVNVSSIYGIIAPAGQTAYCASKFAVRGFTEALRHEYADTGLGVTLVHPGGVATGIARNARVPRGADAGVVAEGVAALERLFKLTPDEAARQILRGIRTRAPRVVVGGDAHRAVLIQRLMPVRYWSLIRRAVEG